MREHERDRERLEHILGAIQVIEDGLGTYSQSELLNKPLFYYGLVKQIEIIGEASNLLTAGFRDRHKEVDWRPIINMRSVLVHDYIHISKDLLWVTLTQDIPELKKHIERYYSEILGDV
ncbi:MAG: DUF86 domain-containing protein [Paludibacteraceae bacterium]|nr:DUF86 domain-containing protein [Paludibacteraceae bacterium]